MDRLIVGVCAPPAAEASVLGLLELLLAARRGVSFDLLWYDPCDAPPSAADLWAWLEPVCPPHRSQQRQAAPPLIIGAGVAPEGRFALPNTALFAPVAERPTRATRRILILPHRVRGFADLPRQALSAVMARWHVELLADQPWQLADIPHGVTCRCLPRGRRWNDVALAADMVITPHEEDALLANAMLRPAILLDSAASGALPFIWPGSAGQLVECIAAYDAERGGILLFNWKRALALACHATLTEWLVEAGYSPR